MQKAAEPWQPFWLQARWRAGGVMPHLWRQGGTQRLAGAAGVDTTPRGLDWVWNVIFSVAHSSRGSQLIDGSGRGGGGRALSGGATAG